MLVHHTASLSQRDHHASLDPSCCLPPAVLPGWPPARTADRAANMRRTADSVPGTWGTRAAADPIRRRGGAKTPVYRIQAPRHSPLLPSTPPPPPFPPPPRSAPWRSLSCMGRNRVLVNYLLPTSYSSLSQLLIRQTEIAANCALPGTPSSDRK